MWQRVAHTVSLYELKMGLPFKANNCYKTSPQLSTTEPWLEAGWISSPALSCSQASPDLGLSLYGEWWSSGPGLGTLVMTWGLGSIELISKCVSRASIQLRPWILGAGCLIQTSVLSLSISELLASWVNLGQLLKLLMPVFTLNRDNCNIYFPSEVVIWIKWINIHILILIRYKNSAGYIIRTT